MNDALIKAGITPVIDLNSASTTRPIALAYIGIVTYQGMAECLGWPAKKIGFEEIIALSNDERGWDSCPTASAEWGKKPLVAFTDPRESSTGRSVLLALYSIASEAPPEEIDMKLVRSDLVTDRVKEFAGLIDHYMIGTSVLNTKIHQGPRFGHFFLMPEDNLIHLKEGTVSAFFGGVKQGAPHMRRRW
jgi:hypothetical protein